MASHCERPGCTQPAEVLYGMSAVTLTVWLDAYDEALAARVGALCRRHADAMVVPRGWSLDDRREAAPPLFRTGREAEAGAAPAKARRRRARRQAEGDDTGQLELIADADGGAGATRTGGGAAPPRPAPATIVEAAAVGQLADQDPTPFSPWRPRFDEDDDLDGLLQARSPLLSRAFRGRSTAAGDKPGDRARGANAADSAS